MRFRVRAHAEPPDRRSRGHPVIIPHRRLVATDDGPSVIVYYKRSLILTPRSQPDQGRLLDAADQSPEGRSARRPWPGRCPTSRGVSMSTHDRVSPRAAHQAPLMARHVTAPTRADARPLEDVATELARLTAQMRQMVSANRALRGTNETLTAANETLTAANTGLRHDRADAQAEMAHAQAETAHAQAETADIRTRNVALQATNDAMDRRTADLEATVADMERAHGALQAHRVAVQELAAVLEAERAQLAVILAGLEDAVLVVDQTGTPLRMNAA